MANNLTDARRSLVRAQESAQKRLAELEAERREIKASIKSLEAAMKALEKRSRRRPSTQPAADQDVGQDESHAEVD